MSGRRTAWGAGRSRDGSGRPRDGGGRSRDGGGRSRDDSKRSHDNRGRRPPATAEVTVDGLLALGATPWPPLRTGRRTIGGPEAFADREAVRRDICEAWRSHTRTKGDPDLHAATPAELTREIHKIPPREYEPDWDDRPRTYRLDGPHIYDPRLSFLVAAMRFLTAQRARHGTVLVASGSRGASQGGALVALSGMFPELEWRLYGVAATPAPAIKPGDESSQAVGWRALYPTRVTLASVAKATPKDVAEAVGGGSPLYIILDLQGDAAGMPRGTPFASKEAAVAAAKNAQDAMCDAAFAEASARGIAAPAVLAWERLPYIVAGSGPRIFKCHAGTTHRAFWGEYGAPEMWREIVPGEMVSVDPTDAEAVEGDRWGRHPALYYGPTLVRAGIPAALLAEIPGYDGCANCAGTIAVFAEHALAHGLPVAEAGGLLRAALRFVGIATLRRVPPRRATPTDPKPCVHGVYADGPLVENYSEIVKAHGAPLSAVRDAIAQASRRRHRR